MLAFATKAHLASRDVIRSLSKKARKRRRRQASRSSSCCRNGSTSSTPGRSRISRPTPPFRAWVAGRRSARSNARRSGRSSSACAQGLAERRLMTPASLFAALTEHLREARRTSRSRTSSSTRRRTWACRSCGSWRRSCRIGPNALFFAGDLGQRIFQPPFSWKGLGIDVRGRSSTLKVNYRTSHQISTAADRLLPKSVRDVDGLEDGRAGTVSVFNGPPPRVLIASERSGRSGRRRRLHRQRARGRHRGRPRSASSFVRAMSCRAPGRRPPRLASA